MLVNLQLALVRKHHDDRVLGVRSFFNLLEPLSDRAYRSVITDVAKDEKRVLLPIDLIVGAHAGLRVFLQITKASS